MRVNHKTDDAFTPVEFHCILIQILVGRPSFWGCAEASY